MRFTPTILSVPVLLIGLAGCGADPAASGEHPAVTPPVGNAPAAPQKPDAAPAADAATNTGGRVLAEVGEVKITDAQVLPVLFDAYGLDVLLKVTQLDLARAAAAQAGVTVSPADIEAERQLTMKLAFPDQKPEDYEELLTQLLTQQRVSRAEFAVVMETNANLRALVRKPSESDITEDAIRNEYNAVYGERVRVRHIALNNLQEVTEAQRRLNGSPAANGQPAVPPEPFEKVAREMSVNRATAANGGELPPFARTSGGYSQVFIDAAFNLKPGEVSQDAIQEGRYYHLIKVVERIAPQVVKFEDVRDTVREELIRRRQNALMGQRRGEMAQIALKNLHINEPTLKKQFEARLAAANPKPAERDEVRHNLDEQRERLNQPATAPTTGPATTTAPAK